MANRDVHGAPRISVAVLTGLVDTIKLAGGRPDEIISNLQLERSLFANREGFIPCSLFARILEETARSTADDCFGLHFGENFNPKDLGPLAYVVLNSPTVTDAIENSRRYFHIHNEAAELSFNVEGQRAYLRFKLADSATDPRRQHNEYAMTVLLNTLRLIAGSTWGPIEVQFAHATPPRTSEHLRIFRAPVLFDCPTNGLVIDSEFVARQVPAADPRLYRILKQHTQRVLDSMPRDTALVAELRKAIAESLREGDPKLVRVVKKLAMTPRTLERRLKEHDLVFRDLLDDTRRRMGMEYLRNRKHTLTEIAFLLGYSEVSAFNRAFRRWTGSTPLKYRRNVHAA
jgi:AraC-like DNA-binding protein